jgi:glycolate oxidase FAD binding subunit
VSGFDMMKLYLGSYGTLAVVASANFKLLPQPRAAGSLLCRFASPQQAFAAAEALYLTQLTPTAAEYLNAGALALVATEDTESTEVRRAGARTAGSPIGASSASEGPASGPSVSSVRSVAASPGECALVVRAEGPPQAVERHLADVAGIAGRNGALAAERLEVPGEAQLWARVADLPQAAELAPGEALVKLAVLPAEVERAAALVEALAEAAGAGAAISARALSGTLYARLGPLEAPALAGLLVRLPGLQWVATDLPGAPRWGPPPQGLEVMRRIKNEFDPFNTLNPGRFVPGI